MVFQPLPPGELEPMPYGLVNPKTLVSEGLRWEGGFTQESVACNAGVRLIDVCDTVTDYDVHVSSGNGTVGDYKPFAVQAHVKCSTMNGLYEDWEKRALMALEACTSNAVEMEFWEGQLTQAVDTANVSSTFKNKYLLNGAMTDVTPTPGTPVKVRHGLALLEGALADAGCGYRGFIHAPVSIASVLPCKDCGDGVLETNVGNYVIAGTGYSGKGPGVADPSATTQRWMFATGPVAVRLGEPVVTASEKKQIINTAINDIELRAERTASAVWDGCAHFGVLVDLSLDYA